MDENVDMAFCALHQNESLVLAEELSPSQQPVRRAARPQWSSAAGIQSLSDTRHAGSLAQSRARHGKAETVHVGLHLARLLIQKRELAVLRLDVFVLCTAQPDQAASARTMLKAPPGGITAPSLQS